MRRFFRLTEPCRFSRYCEYYRKDSMTCNDDGEAVHYCGILRQAVTAVSVPDAA
ncbi:MAG: hypothetical protein QXJ74_09865 [Nitrososphaera sp.]|uniref:hypothetical protein n=1 Tax=Nitrososphaera sp. TaxID=1971748 RepID=UPI001842C63B|nr:hypothetical protein [Nitrososphaera sp.]NWG38297.1 hypothetical protein [Nitrososphaera sp.]